MKLRSIFEMPQTFIVFIKISGLFSARFLLLLEQWISYMMQGYEADMVVTLNLASGSIKGL